MGFRAASVVFALLLVQIAAAAQLWAQTKPGAPPIVVASKPFGESYVLAEMFAQALESRGIAVRRLPGLGSTEILFGAVRAGEVDVYPEYTGTGLIAILKEAPVDHAGPRAVFAHVAGAFQSRYGIRWLPPLGFENTFAVAVRPDTAQQYGLRSLTDLARHSSTLTAGFTPDFVQRPDGLAGLARVYGESIRPPSIRPLLPALKYQAVAEGAVDVIDGFSTDGLLERYGLIVLDDDRDFFPPYEAAALLGRRAAANAEVVSALTMLSGKIDETMMRSLNRRVEMDAEDVGRVASSALDTLGLTPTRDGMDIAGTATASEASASREESLGSYFWTRRATLLTLTLRHLWLVAVSLAGATLVAVPIGLALERARKVAGLTLGGLGVLQTVPSIALLAFMVPLLGVGVVPALVAVWLYALFPIARGTYSGVRDADPAAVEAAEALGMTPRQRLLLVRLPLAAPVIVAGVRTAGVISVGATTLAAFIGAGGLGEPIITGLALADARMVLFGAVPAAALAVCVDGALSMVERRFTPPHLSKHPGRLLKPTPA